MSQNFFSSHVETLKQAVSAIQNRTYWTPFPEMPSPKIYGETANEEGRKAFEMRLGKRFELDQLGAAGEVGEENSPFGIDLGITYQRTNPDVLFSAVGKAVEAWRKVGPEAWAGVALESLFRLNKRSFEIAYAVMHSTGQAFMMAFQAGGPHAQDRGLEAVAYAWDEMSRIPKSALWEKPQGKNEPLRLEKRFRIIPRGVSLVIGCCTFPTWNSYPGLFASLTTGNAVIVKPHPGAILPLAITVEIIRQVLNEAGFNPNVVTLVAHSSRDDVAQRLATHSDVKIIDFTGSTKNGEWLEHNARQAEVFTEKAGVNQIIVDSTNDFKGMIRNIAFSLSLYSGQMCTAPQNIYVPKDGIDTNEGHLTFDQVVSALGDGISKLVADPARAVEVLGALQNKAILSRLENARSVGEIVTDTRKLEHPQFPNARVYTPLLLKTSAADEGTFMQEFFGPITFVIATEDTAQSICIAERGAKEHGALTMSVYSTSEKVLDDVRDIAARAGVSLSCNLTGGVFVNQSAAFSDYHGSGANPAANASLTDAAFVASRFRVAQSRAHV